MFLYAVWPLTLILFLSDRKCSADPFVSASFDEKHDAFHPPAMRLFGALRFRFFFGTHRLVGVFAQLIANLSDGEYRQNARICLVS